MTAAAAQSPAPDDDDVPSPIDLRRMADAAQWAGSAMLKRPGRMRFFDAMADELSRTRRVASVLELGSGPGFLARHVLERRPDLAYTALDFSAAMHELARERLGDLAVKARFIERDFKTEDWPRGLGPFDAVLTLQAVHELRHKRHAVGLHRQARALLRPGGFYLVCDHWAGEGGMRDPLLYMSVDEQCHALLDAGFARVDRLLLDGTLVLHRAS